MPYIETYQEQMLLDVGYDALSTVEKNKLIAVLADREGISYAEVNEAYILEHHKKLKVGIISEICEEAVLEGFHGRNGHHYRTNRDDQLNMLAQRLELFMDETITTVPWKTEDVGYVIHSRTEWMAMFAEAFDYKKAMLYKYNTMKAAIAKAASHAELVGIQWEKAPVPTEPIATKPAPTEPTPVTPTEPSPEPTPTEPTPEPTE